MALTSSLVVGVKAPLECWPIAVDRVRYVGEPVAIVVASDRYRAEDAVDLIEMRYRPLPAVVDPVAAATADSPLLHPAINSNVVGERTFRYGDPERAFAEAAHRVRVDVRYPRNSCTPIETYGIVAEYDADEDAYDVLANFQGPFSLHPVMARALKVPGNRSLLHLLRRQWCVPVGPDPVPNRRRMGRAEAAGSVPGRASRQPTELSKLKIVGQFRTSGVNSAAVMTARLAAQ